MRNYIYALRSTIHFFDNTNTETGFYPVVSATEDDLTKDAQVLFDYLVPLVPGLSYFTVETLGLDYIELNKEKVIYRLINFGFNFRTGVIQNGVFGDPIRSADPRYDPDWPTSDGDFGRMEQGGPKGGILNPLNVQLGLAQLLQSLYSELYIRGGIYRSAASRILPVLLKVLRATVTQADIDGLFAFLKKFGI